MVILMNESKSTLTLSPLYHRHDHLGYSVHVESLEVVFCYSVGAINSVKATRNINSHASQKVIEVKRRAQLLSWLGKSLLLIFMFKKMPEVGRQ